MALKLQNGGTYRCVFAYHGESGKGKYKLVRLKDEKGRNSTTLFYDNDDSGIDIKGECEFKVRVDSFGFEKDGGATWGVKKAGEKWYPDLTFNGCKLYKVSDNAPKENPFQNGVFTPIEDDSYQLPF